MLARLIQPRDEQAPRVVGNLLERGFHRSPHDLVRHFPAVDELVRVTTLRLSRSMSRPKRSTTTERV